jgi:hypothetical protein
MYQDNVLGIAQGDWIVCRYTGLKLYRFRAGPVTNGTAGVTTRGNTKAYGRLRRPKTLRSLRWAYAHLDEGIRVRANGNIYLPTMWDDHFAHNERCWKRHRLTQYHPAV